MAYDDKIGALLLDAEDTGNKQDIYEILDSYFTVYKTVLNYPNKHQSK